MTKAPVRDKQIVDLPTASRHAGVSVGTMRGWIRRGLIPRVSYPGTQAGKFLQAVRVDLCDVDAFIERSKKGKA